ncbi:MAG: hypothetical protein ACXVCO_21240, partial [Ktedonobacterales bacterium]
PNGSQVVMRDFVTTTWLPMDHWQPGETLAVRTPAFFLYSTNLGTLRLGVRVLSGTDEAAPNAFLPPALVSAAGAAGNVPAISQDGTRVIFADMPVR